MAEDKSKKTDKKKKKKKKPLTETEKRNRRRTEYNRRQLKGGKDLIRGLYLEGIDATPELGRLASRPEGLWRLPDADPNSEGQPYPPRIMPVLDEKPELDEKNKGGYVKKYANGGSVRKVRV